ncbi:E3 ubiquitin-protein ligase Praja-2 [Falco biarmicus]|uniref:E3 ubiquitin-protein ligase Praja-2 n=1 Tax=Falco cherrug TaxID=345164 RepID=UPI0006B732F1|nr:E3 ubiquitin-protein ligase Praja-2 [Falco cherrug]XP_037230380.1 E3 ubiquitin-protein ligase Praja-2 [Falco rusticolus]XP_037230381.1 E3 ubiquitin-protein ligase Praja-2 [Falco rusticolus]XP_037230382.1 E3 ubiquitin-protein ligase Praja-2 [Falco rusticolus]XP_056181679.1 E3 ubiquitin-protein ligase Praja-2 [Falco biarmicus]
MYRTTTDSNMEEDMSTSTLDDHKGCSPLDQVSSGLLNESLPQNTGNQEPSSQNTSSQNSEVNTPSSPFSGLEGIQISNLTGPFENSVDLGNYASGECNNLNGQNGIALVNNGSSQPDSNDGEEDDDEDRDLASEMASLFQQTLDRILSKLVEETMIFSELKSSLFTLCHGVPGGSYEEIEPIPLMRDSGTDPGLACLDNKTSKSSADHQAIQNISSKPSGPSHETQEVQQIVESPVENLQSSEVELFLPPAAKETIDCLPHVVIANNGQEQCCAICCKGYVEGEIVTELPCHHMFHKICIIHFLQKVDTCPVFRVVLAPVLPEAAAAVPSPSDPSSASSVHGATGASN